MMKNVRKLKPLVMLPLCALFFFIGVVTVQAATYYVATTGNDAVTCPNAVNILTPKRTIASGLTCLASGDTLYLRGGTYSEGINTSSQNLPSGTSFATATTIAGYSGETVRLRPTGCIILSLGLTTTHHVIFKDFIVDGVNLTNQLSQDCEDISMGSEGSPIHHIRFQNIEITNAPRHGFSVRGDSNELLNLHCHHNGLGAMQVGYGPGSNCIYAVATNTLVQGGLYHDNVCYAIRFVNSGTVIQANNNIVNGVTLHSNGRDHAFSGTAVCNSGGGGIVLGDQTNTAQNNILYNNWVSIDTFTGGLGFINNTHLYNNTVTTSEVGIFVRSSNQRNTLIMNNHVVGNTSDIVDNGTGTLITTNRTTGVITDCTVSTSDFHPKVGSACIDAGSTISSMTVDFDGFLRPQGVAHDIGAYEGNGTINPPPTRPVNLQVF